MPQRRTTSDSHSPAERHLATSFPLDDFSRAIGKPAAAPPPAPDPGSEQRKVIPLETAVEPAAPPTRPFSDPAPTGQGSALNPYAEWKKQFILNPETAERLENILAAMKRSLGYSTNRSEFLRVVLLALDDAVVRRFLSELDGLGAIKRRPYKKDNQRENLKLERTLAQALRRCMKP